MEAYIINKELETSTERRSLHWRTGPWCHICQLHLPIHLNGTLTPRLWPLWPCYFSVVNTVLYTLLRSSAHKFGLRWTSLTEIYRNIVKILRHFTGEHILCSSLGIILLLILCTDLIFFAYITRLQVPCASEDMDVVSKWSDPLILESLEDKSPVATRIFDTMIGLLLPNTEIKIIKLKKKSVAIIIRPNVCCLVYEFNICNNLQWLIILISRWYWWWVSDEQEKQKEFLSRIL